MVKLRPAIPGRLIDTDGQAEELGREAISGQICRCTGYATVVRSIRWAAERERVHTKEEVRGCPSS